MTDQQSIGSKLSPKIERIHQGDFREISGLLRSSIPNALVSHLGLQFGSAYYAAIVAQPESFGFVARDAQGSVVGVIIGSLDALLRKRFLTLSQIVTLILAANVRLARPALVWWMLQGVKARLANLGNWGSDKAKSLDRPRPELLAVAVSAEYKGSGLAGKLVCHFEEVLRANGSASRTYCIHTEASNHAANRFYCRIGAELALTIKHHGKEINQWQKRL